MRAVILAGGVGSRLRPYTAVLPKPLMPVGDRPILEIVVGQLREAGFDRLTFAVGHLASLLRAFFGDGSRFGVSIDYSMEDSPLGTAGPLSLIEPPDEPFLVMNGDLLTDLDYRAMMELHHRSGAIATLAVARKEVKIDLGVLQMDDRGDVTGYVEKPTLHYDVSSGIYCFRPDILDHLERGARCDLPDLVHRLLAAGERVRTQPLTGYWLDIGRPEDYDTAVREFVTGRFERSR